MGEAMSALRGKATTVYESHVPCVGTARVCPVHVFKLVLRRTFALPEATSNDSKHSVVHLNSRLKPHIFMHGYAVVLQCTSEILYVAR